jgi:short-subunit dehydrogenase
MATDGTHRYRVALVTGGGTGIGRGIAAALVRRGVAVALAGRRTAPLEATVQALAARGGRAVALPADLADPAVCDALLARTEAALGPLDLLVHNAGVFAGGTLDLLEPGEVARAVATNLVAPIELTRQALPGLAARRGAVVLVASATSFVPQPGAVLYSATKAGLHAFGEALRYEVEPQGVRLLVVYPPGTDTAMVRGMAAAAGVGNYPLVSPGVTGERIVRALYAGRPTLAFGAQERALIWAYRLAPGLVRALFRSQRELISRMMAATRR